MKISFLSLCFLVLAFVNSHAQDINLSIVAKANYSLPSSEAGIPLFSEFNELFLISDLSPDQVSGLPGFEIGGALDIHLTPRFALSSGLFFQQTRYSVAAVRFQIFNPNGENPIIPITLEPQPNPFFFPGNNPVLNPSTTRILNFFKIPLKASYAAVENRFYLSGGVYGAMLYSQHNKTPNTVSPVFIPNTFDPFNTIQMGLQFGMRFQFSSQFALLLDYDHALNDVFVNETFQNENIKSLSLGLSWQVN